MSVTDTDIKAGCLELEGCLNALLEDRTDQSWYDAAIECLADLERMADALLIDEEP